MNGKLALAVCVLVLASIIGSEAALSRKCSSNDDCIFNPAGEQYGSQYSCRAGQCQCEMVRFADGRWWKHTENGSTCTINGAGGPCGTDRGMEVTCEGAYQCLESRCRDPARINTAEEGHACDNDIDCVKPLVCGPNPNPRPFSVAKTCQKAGGKV